MSFLAQGAEARRGPATCRDPTAGTSGTWLRTHRLSLPNQPGRRLGKEASAWKTARRRPLHESAVRPGLALRLADPARGAHSPALPRAESWAGSQAPSPHRRGGDSRTAVGQTPGPVWGGKTQLRGSGTCAILLRHTPVLALMSPVTPAARGRCLGPPDPHARGAARPSESDGPCPAQAASPPPSPTRSAQLPPRSQSRDCWLLW